jgi:membrane protein
MGDPDASDESERDDGDETDRHEESDHESLREELDDLRDDVDEFEAEIEDRTVHREEIEDDLQSYVRKRVRRGHARGWGPYLVLLYGTAMTIGAFVKLSGVWAILAMLVIWLSTLGLYVLMILVGLGIAALSTPGRAMRAVRGLIDTLRNVRS